MKGYRHHPKDNRGTWNRLSGRHQVFQLINEELNIRRDLDWSLNQRKYLYVKEGQEYIPDGPVELFVIERNYTTNNDPTNTIQNSRQITNRRYRENQKGNCLSNSTDQIATYFRELCEEGSAEYCRRLVKEKNGQTKPCLVCYMDWQLDAICEYCTTANDNPQPLGKEKSSIWAILILLNFHLIGLY